MNGDQNISTLGTTLEQTYSALEGKYEPQKIVELMTSVGFEGQDVVNFVNNKYEENRVRQLEELDNQQKLMEEQRALYDSLKKKRWCIRTRWGTFWFAAGWESKV